MLSKTRKKFENGCTIYSIELILILLNEIKNNIKEINTMKQCYVQSSFSRLRSQYNYPLLENVHKDSKALKSNTIFICYNIIPDEKVSSIINKPLEQVKDYLISALIKLNELPENFNIEINNIKDIQKINRIFRVSNNERNVRDIEMTLSKMEQ